MTPEGLGGQLPPGLLGMQPPGAGPALSLQDESAQQEGEVDPLAALQDAIHALMGAQIALPDAQDVQDVSQAMVLLARVQTRLMKAAGPGQ